MNSRQGRGGGNGNFSLSTRVYIYISSLKKDVFNIYIYNIIYIDESALLTKGPKELLHNNKSGDQSQFSGLHHRNAPQSPLLLVGSQSPSEMKLGRQDPVVVVVPESENVSYSGRVVTSSSSTQEALGSTHAKPPNDGSPHVKSEVLTQVHSQQSPPS